MIQWLGLCTFTAKSAGSITGHRTKILQAVLRGQKQKLKKKEKRRWGNKLVKQEIFISTPRHWKIKTFSLTGKESCHLNTNRAKFNSFIYIKLTRVDKYIQESLIVTLPSLSELF